MLWIQFIMGTVARTLDEIGRLHAFYSRPRTPNAGFVVRFQGGELALVTGLNIGDILQFQLRFLSKNILRFLPALDHVPTAAFPASQVTGATAAAV